MSMSFDRALNLLLVVSAVAVASAVTHREFFSAPSDDVGKRFVDSKNWREIATAGTGFGPSNAPVVVTVFSDFECPVCKLFHEGLQAVRKKHPELVAVSFVHFPLSYHESARRIAVASECAGRQDKFERFVDFAFSRQDSLVSLHTDALASGAMVPSLTEYRDCIARNEPAVKIDRSLALGRDLAVKGTPTVLVNGRRYVSAPDSIELEEAILAEAGIQRSIRGKQ